MTRPTPRAEDLEAQVFGTDTLEPVTDLKAEGLKDTISTLLSAAAILTMAVGVTWGVWPWLGPFALCSGALWVAVALAYSDAARQPKPVKLPRRTGAAIAPGPSSPGNLHAKGPGAKP